MGLPTPHPRRNIPCIENVKSVNSEEGGIVAFLDTVSLTHKSGTYPPPWIRISTFGAFSYSAKWAKWRPTLVITRLNYKKTFRYGLSKQEGTEKAKNHPTIPLSYAVFIRIWSVSGRRPVSYSWPNLPQATLWTGIYVYWPPCCLVYGKVSFFGV